MEEVMTISKIPHADLAFDYEGLRSKGIEHIRDTASAIWTDHNIHDPGITSLEILCYAITDLSYRGSYSIPDLLRRKDNHAVDIIQSFLTAKKIFPNKALTINDYRKLLINIEGVKNVWLRKRSRSLVADLTNKKLVFSVPAGSTTSAVDIKGYYEVLLEFDTTIKTPEDQIKLINEARTLLNANRNLAEDFHEIRKVDQQSFRLCCEIEMKPDADATETMADIFFRIQLHLSPLVRFYSLQQLHGDRNEKFTTDRIFEGPFISKGFIKIKELVASELKNEIHLSDLMQLILDKDEVNNVTEILFNDVNQQTELENRWVIPVNKGFQPVVDILQSNIVIYKNGMPVRINKPAIKLQYDKLMDDYLKQNENMKSEDLRFDTGRYRQVEQYHSIQHHFPKTYGISHWGLPPEVTVERQKQAKQLQGYLLLFDQLMADYLAQLSSLGNLFSTADEKNTFFTQLVKDFKDPSWLYSSYSEILNGGKIDEEKSWKNSVSRIQDIAEQKGSPQFYKRRNLFLDHLLSRFAESFYDYINIYISHFPGQATDEKIVELKRKFLQDYPEYSANRACAYNYALSASFQR